MEEGRKGKGEEEWGEVMGEVGFLRGELVEGTPEEEEKKEVVDSGMGVEEEKEESRGEWGGVVQGSERSIFLI